MPVVVYTDYLYRERDGAIFAERAFARFLEAVAHELGGLRLLGRLDSRPGAAHYRLGHEVEFVPLPSYTKLTNAGAVVRALPGTITRMYRALDDADAVWSLGPYPYALALALLARLRRRRLVLGVRQDFPAYVRNRHPRRPALHLAASMLEVCWRLLARRSPVVAVGGELAVRYGRSPHVLAVTVSLIRARDVREGARAACRDYDGPELTLLSVGRLDAEKNPLLLADVLALLREHDPRWRLLVCGEGELRGELAGRIERLGLSGFAELRGYVPLDGGLLKLYRASSVFLHVSMTEGLPQVLIEAYASGLPTVATAVGGVRELGGSSLLVAPADAGAAASAVQRLVSDVELRRRLVAAGLRRAGEETLETQASAVARFLAA